MENEDRRYCVYIHINKINGKKYCGQTCKNLKSRFGKNGYGYKECPRFYNAILKYGWDNFDHVVLQDHLTKEEADKLEIQTIEQYNLTDDEYGYNINQGGQLKQPKFEDLTGQVFGRLTVIKPDPVEKEHWICKCTCGNEVSIISYSLKKGATKSCGCYKKDRNKEYGKNRTDCHRQCGTKIYRIWSGLKNRKTAINGICPEWNDFVNFYEWSIETGYTDGQHLLQIDPTLGFNPDNCIWGTKKEAMQNASSKYYNVYGQYKNIEQISKEYNISIGALHQRIKKSSILDWDKILNTTYKYIPQKTINEYVEYEDYGIIKIKHQNIDIVLDLDKYEFAKQFIWKADQHGNIVTSQVNNQEHISLLYFVLGIHKKGMKSFKPLYIDGNRYNLRLSNIQVIIPNCINESDYWYIMRNIPENGIAIDNGIRIGKKGDSKKSFHDLKSALEYYDSQYSTNLLQEYMQYLQNN